MIEFIKKNHLLILILIILVTSYYYYFNKQENFVDPPPSRTTPIITLYYATWCSACSGFRPIWDEFKKQVKIKVREKDCSDNNSCPNIPGFPTIILTTSSGKNINYTGDRTVQDLLDFVSSN